MNSVTFLLEIFPISLFRNTLEFKSVTVHPFMHFLQLGNLVKFLYSTTMMLPVFFPTPNSFLKALLRLSLFLYNAHIFFLYL